MFWDHLPGTYTAEADEPLYGVTEPIHTHHPVHIQLAGLHWLANKIRSAPTFSAKALCLLMPPEWSRQRWPSPSEFFEPDHLQVGKTIADHSAKGYAPCSICDRIAGAI